MQLRLQSNNKWVRFKPTGCYFVLVITKNDRKLAKQIRLIRKKQGLQQQELADMVDVSPKHLQYVEAAKRKPSLKLLYKIAKSLQVKVKDLFTF